MRQERVTASDRQYNRIDAIELNAYLPRMAIKSHQLQIRVTPNEKSAIRRLAQAAGLDVSSYVLARALPATQVRFDGLLRALAAPHGRSYVLAELNDFLGALSGPELADGVGLVERAVLEALPEYERNYVAAMVELACARRDRPPPTWTSDVRSLTRPRFGTELKSVRPHLLRASPVPFKRRNIFIDASIGDRV
jgi:hypothetical protein